jgi:hypothetical protein
MLFIKVSLIYSFLICFSEKLDQLCLRSCLLGFLTGGGPDVFRTSSWLLFRTLTWVAVVIVVLGFARPRTWN